MDGGELEMSFNKLSPAEAERIALLMEECGEVVQACGKILRHGYFSCHPEGIVTNRSTLERELGDVWVAIYLMIENGDLNRSDIDQYSKVKARNIHKYLHHQGE